jgi:uroporphyrinogen decarboxylase
LFVCIGVVMRQMTGLERCLTVMDGGIADSVPVIPQAFLFSARTAGYKIGQICGDAAKLAKSHIVCQDEYGYDGCTIDVDDATLAEACGAKCLFRDDDVVATDEHNPLLKDLKDIDQLKMPDPLKDGRLPVWLEITERLSKEIGDHVYIMGRADQGPFDLACLLRGTQNFMMDLIMGDPEEIRALLEWCKQAHILFAKAQIDAGAHITSMGDSYAGPNLVSPDIYKKYALQPEIDVVNAVHAHGGKYSVHICGDTTKIIGDMAKTNADVIEVDWQVDMGEARRLFGEKTILMGNIDPSDPLVFGTPEAVDAKAKDIIEKTKGKGLFLSSGCAMGANTKPENMKAMIEAAKKYGTYEQVMALNT